MKTTPLLAALLLMQARAGAQSAITVDIWRAPDLNEFGIPDPGAYPTVFVGSYTVPMANPYSPELNFNADTLDWRPFGLSWFKADIHGSFTVATPGTDQLMFRGGIMGRVSIASLTIDGNYNPVLFTSSIDSLYQNTVTLSKGLHSFDLIYMPGQSQTLVGPGDVQTRPNGKDGIAIVDVDHTWGPTSSVPESTWLVWLFPLGLLLWRRK